MNFISLQVKNFAKNANCVKIFLIGGGLYIIALFALLRGNVYYMDDWGRSYTGNGFLDHSRYTAHKLFGWVSANMGFVDISPITQFISIILLVLSSMILLFVIAKKFDILGMIATLPLGLSPFYLENLSYKFDCVTMSFSVFFAIVPFLFKERKLIFGVISVYCLVCMYSSYQASNGIFIVLCMYFSLSLYFLEGKSFKESASFALVGAISFVLGTLIYQYCLVDYMVSTYVYTKPFALPDMVSGILYNLLAYLGVVYNSLASMSLFYCCVGVLILFPLCFALLSRRKILAFIFASIFVCAGICLSFGAYLALEMPLFYARAFIGIGVLIALVNIICISIKPRILKAITASLVVAMAYCCIVFATAYGNALTAQNEYAKFRNAILANDIANIISKDKVGFIFDGEIGYAGAAKRFVDVYKHIGENLIRASVIDYPMGYNGTQGSQTPSLFWNSLALYHLSIPVKNELNSYKECENLNDRDTKIIIDNWYHTITQNNQCLIVTFKSPKMDL